MSERTPSGREEILECQVMWEPDSKRDTQMDRFRAAVGASYGLALGECGSQAPEAQPLSPSPLPPPRCPPSGFRVPGRVNR